MDTTTIVLPKDLREKIAKKAKESGVTEKQLIAELAARLSIGSFDYKSTDES